DIRGIGQGRNRARGNEGTDFDAAKTGLRKKIDQRDLLLRRHPLRFDLQAVTWPNLLNLHPRRHMRHCTAPLSRSFSTSRSLMPSPLKTSSVCCPSAGPGHLTSPGVSESFGAMPGIFT